MVAAKILVIGAKNVGKSTCILMYRGIPAERRIPPEEEPYTVSCTVDGTSVALTLHEMSEEPCNRPGEWQNTDVILLLFSIDSLESLRCIREDLFPDLNTILPGVPILLVACKTDLRKDQQTIDSMKESHGRSPISPEEGLALSQELNAMAYFEVCGDENRGLNEVFEAAAKAALAAAPETKKKSCIVM